MKKAKMIRSLPSTMILNLRWSQKKNLLKSPGFQIKNLVKKSQLTSFHGCQKVKTPMPSRVDKKVSNGPPEMIALTRKIPQTSPGMPSRDPRKKKRSARSHGLIRALLSNLVQLLKLLTTRNRRKKIKKMISVWVFKSVETGHHPQSTKTNPIFSTTRASSNTKMRTENP